VSIPKAANDPPAERTSYANLSFTPEGLMLEYNLSIFEAREFLECYEEWILDTMREAGRDLIHEFACEAGILRYDDIED